MGHIFKLFREELGSLVSKEELGPDNEHLIFFTTTGDEDSDLLYKLMKGKELPEWYAVYEILYNISEQRKGSISKKTGDDKSNANVENEAVELPDWLKSENEAMNRIFKLFREELGSLVTSEELGPGNEHLSFFTTTGDEDSDLLHKLMKGKELTEWYKVYQILYNISERRKGNIPQKAVAAEPESGLVADEPRVQSPAVLESVDDVELDATQLLARKLRQVIESRDENALLLEEKTMELATLKAELKEKEETGESVAERLEASEQALEDVGNQMHLLIALTRMGGTEL